MDDPPLAEEAAGDGVAGVPPLLDAERQLALTPALLDGLSHPQPEAPGREEAYAETRK